MLMSERFNAYRVMWIFVSFDLPTVEKEQRKAYSIFRKRLIKGGFTMFQFSLYGRVCASRQAAEVWLSKVRCWLPEDGKLILFTLTDKQFEQMRIVYGNRERKRPESKYKQLELF